MLLGIALIMTKAVYTYEMRTSIAISLVPLSRSILTPKHQQRVRTQVFSTAAETKGLMVFRDIASLLDYRGLSD